VACGNSVNRALINPHSQSIVIVDGVVICWITLFRESPNWVCALLAITQLGLRSFGKRSIGCAPFWQSLNWQSLFWQTPFWQSPFWQSLFWQSPFWLHAVVMIIITQFEYMSIYLTWFFAAKYLFSRKSNEQSHIFLKYRTNMSRKTRAKYFGLLCFTAKYMYFIYFRKMCHSFSIIIHSTLLLSHQSIKIIGNPNIFCVKNYMKRIFHKKIKNAIFVVKQNTRKYFHIVFSILGRNTISLPTKQR